LILCSILFNFFAGKFLLKNKSKFLLAFSVSVNVLLLGYYKYAGFFLSLANDLVSANMSTPQIALPLAISFFTFQQIAFLVDTYNGKVVRSSLTKYMLFVSFFPQLIAGPIVKQQDIVNDLNDKKLMITMSSFTLGFTMFVLGLFKKVVLADTFGDIADPVFGSISQGNLLPIFTCWKGLLSYSLQIYFDFSAYADMAIGIGHIFGLRLPLNFDSPYKSNSIREFWNKWHITLSRFIRDYIYIPLGGSKKGEIRHYANLMTAMLLCGLWHGAGWSFVIWGGLHGVLLSVNHLYSNVLIHRSPFVLKKIIQLISGPGTLLCVILAWVPFRVETSNIVDFYRCLFIGPVGAPDAKINQAYMHMGKYFSCH